MAFDSVSFLLVMFKSVSYHSMSVDTVSFLASIFPLCLPVSTFSNRYLTSQSLSIRCFSQPVSFKSLPYQPVAFDSVSIQPVSFNPSSFQSVSLIQYLSGQYLLIQYLLTQYLLIWCVFSTNIFKE
jgi:hypothetical protein